MTDSDEITYAMYAGLSADEESVLKRFDGYVLSTLRDNGVYLRPIWISRTDANDRFVQLYGVGNSNPGMLFERSSSQLLSLTPHELRSGVEENLKQH